MRALLIVPRFTAEPGGYYEFPLGLSLIAACLKREGHETLCLNLNHAAGDPEALVAEAVKRFEPRLACTGGLSVHFGAVKAILGAVRACSQAETVVGGGIVTSEPELMMRALDADYGVLGEGEDSAVELAAALEQGADPTQVPGIILRRQDGSVVRTATRPPIKDLDRLPFPDLDAFGLARYLDMQRPSDNYYLYYADRPRLVPVISSRSCPFKCTFCFHPLGDVYRTRSLDSLFAEIDGLVDRHDVNGLAILDELFAADPGRLEAFATRIKPYKLKWIAQLRVDAVDRHSLALLRESGLMCISYGLESASETILKSMRKKISVPGIAQTLAMTREAGIGIQGNFLFGDPAETRDTARETLAWWEAHPDYGINLTHVIPYPGCADYLLCRERGLIPDPLAFIEQGCPPVNMTAMDDPTYFLISKEIARLSSAYRKRGTLRKPRFLSLDLDKAVPTYAFAALCPQCGEESRYANFCIDRPRFIRLACRACNQRFDLPSSDLPRVREVLDDLGARIHVLRQHGTPLAVTPCLFEPTFMDMMELLGLDWRGLGIDCFLDDRAQKIGQPYLEGHPVLRRDQATLAGPLAGHAVLVLPAPDQDALVRNLLMECQVEPQRILSYTPPSNPQEPPLNVFERGV